MCKLFKKRVKPLPQYVCHDRRAIPVTSLLPWTFTNFHQLVNSKRCKGLISEPGDQPVVDGLCLSVPCTLWPLLLAGFRDLIAWQGLHRGVRPPWGPKRRDRDPTCPSWGIWSEHLKVHIGQLLSIWPGPIYGTHTQRKHILKTALYSRADNQQGILFLNFLSV